MLDQAARLREQMAHINKENATRLITITSGKGGVGKSNFVVNLAISLRKQGKKVLIFDADIGMGNDDVLMGLYPRYNVLDLIKNNLNIEDVIITGPEGVDLLPGGSGMNYIEELSEEERLNFLSKINSLDGYDYILIDTGAGISKNILAFIQASETLILVTTPEPTSITDGYSLLKAVDTYKIKDEVLLVVNKVFDYEEGNTTYFKYSNTITKFLKIKTKYIGCILDDKKLVASVKEQVPVVLNYPSSDAASCIRKITNRILNDYDIMEDSKDGAKGFFKRLFNIFS